MDQGETGIDFHFQSMYCFASLSKNSLFDIIYEDADLLVINKPAGLVCHPTKDGPLSSLIGRARLYVGEGLSCHFVNRLDRETSGVTLVAKNSRTAGELGIQLQKRLIEKEYLAIVHGVVTPATGTIELPLGKDEKSEISIKDCARPDGTPARTDYAVERSFKRAEGDFSLLRIRPHTGRKHQIRIHLATVGHPIVGDKLYGGNEDLYLALVHDRLTDADKAQLLMPHQALHAVSLKFVWRGASRTFIAVEPASFSGFLAGDSCHQYW